MNLSRDAYVGIFLGKIKKWDDPVIVKANPGATLPSTPITVVTRSDGSGTTFVFTTHLSAISPEWKAGPGAGKSVNFPVGVAGKGNPGVTALIKQTPGAIGYVEYGYAKQTEHADGGAGEQERQVRQGGPRRAARMRSRRRELPADLRAWIPDPTAQRRVSDRHLHLAALLQEVRTTPRSQRPSSRWSTYGLAEGQKDSVDLGYIPLPSNVVDKVNKAARSDFMSAAGAKVADDP